MAMTGLQIFKYLPAASKAENSNCKKCGCQTCMMYAVKLAKNNIEIDKCPYITEELRKEFSKNIKHPQKTVKIRNLNIGGENVLYRHEKTFVNPTVIAIIVDCENQDYAKKIEQIQNFGINILGEKVGVDLIILKNSSKTNFATNAAPATHTNNTAKTGDTPSTLATLTSQAGDTTQTGSAILTADTDQATNDTANTTDSSHTPSTPAADTGSAEIITYEELCNLELNIIEEKNFHSTKDYLISTRQKAILDRDDNYSSPVCVVMDENPQDIYSLCARASYYICKYANMLIFESTDEEMLSTLLILRHNIFTNPQQNLQVAGGLYKFNNPDKNSIVFMTTNFALTFFAVANELENLEVPSYLIIVPAQGMSVLTAWSAQTFTPEIVENILKEYNIRELISNRKIVIPGLLSDMKEELNEKCADFEFIEGTHEAADIKYFVKNFQK